MAEAAQTSQKVDLPHLAQQGLGLLGILGPSPSGLHAGQHHVETGSRTHRSLAYHCKPCVGGN
ncbi:MAG: hypothetical protein EBS04_08575 [Chitinophagia bacterium]|nr:hypothetical protein [Chitinophagia bacterium]